MSASAFSHSFITEVKNCEAVLSQRKEREEEEEEEKSSSLQGMEPDTIVPLLGSISLRCSQPPRELVGSVPLFPQSGWKPAPFEKKDTD